MIRQSTSAKRGGPGCDQGFSLIEIMIVLLVVATISAFVVPQVLAHMRAYRLGVGARNLATALQRARYLATSNNTLAGITLLDSQHINIQQLDPAGVVPPQLKGTIEMPEGILISADAPKQLSFDGRGLLNPLPADSVALRVDGADGYYILVTTSLTGQVSLSDTRHN